MLIGELSRATGVSPRLLRYYEQQGLLETERQPNGYRSYPREAVTTVRQIRALLAAGLGTGVIRDVLPCAREELPKLDLCPRLVQVLTAELDAIDGQIGALERSRSTLATLLSE